MNHIPQLSVLFEMLRSFTTLAGTLNLSKTVETLGVTRQTVRRHINQLEDMKGVKLFEVEDRRYKLTVAGSQSAREAESILNKAHSWLSGRHGHDDYVAGLAHAEYEEENGSSYYAQQHPLDRMWEDSPPLLQKGYLAWSNARFEIDSPLMDPLKPYVLVYRKHRNYWVCAHVGEKSSLASWYGWEKSYLGRIMEEIIGDSGQVSIVTRTYAEVMVAGGARLDHVFAQVRRRKDATPDPVSYQRLLCACRFPDGEPAMMILVARTNRVSIPCVHPDKIPVMPDELLMEFDI